MDLYSLNGRYTTAETLAKTVGIRRDLTLLFCERGRFIGAVKINKTWLIPIPLKVVGNINSNKTKIALLEFMNAWDKKTQE